MKLSILTGALVIGLTTLAFADVPKQSTGSAPAAVPAAPQPPPSCEDQLRESKVLIQEIGADRDRAEGYVAQLVDQMQKQATKK